MAWTIQRKDFYKKNPVPEVLPDDLFFKCQELNLFDDIFIRTISSKENLNYEDW